MDSSGTSKQDLDRSSVFRRAPVRLDQSNQLRAQICSHCNLLKEKLALGKGLVPWFWDTWLLVNDFGHYQFFSLNWNDRFVSAAKSWLIAVQLFTPPCYMGEAPSVPTATNEFVFHLAPASEIWKLDPFKSHNRQACDLWHLRNAPQKFQWSPSFAIVIYESHQVQCYNMRFSLHASVGSNKSLQRLRFSRSLIHYLMLLFETPSILLLDSPQVFLNIFFVIAHPQ